MMLGSMFNVAIASIAIFQSGRSALAFVWLLAIIPTVVFVYIRRIARRSRPKPAAASVRGIRRTIASGFVQGVLWASVPAFFYAGNSNAAQIVIISLSAGMLATGSLALATIPAASFAFAAPLVVACMVGLLLDGSQSSLLVALMTPGFCFLLLRAVIVINERLVTKIVEKTKADEVARSDALTGLMNRAGYVEYLENKALFPMKRHGIGFAVLHLDLDNFKLVNDTMGHDAGDELLQRVAERLLTTIRPEDCVARVGGDEFAIIIRDVDRPEILASIAERIVHAFNGPFFVHGKPVRCKTSIGIARAPHDGNDVASINKSADVALYLAKKKARGNFVFLEGALDEQVRKRKALGRALAEAISHDQLFLEFQPIYSASHGQPTAFETLLRWTHPEEGPINPAEFIPIAEELGLIQDIGEWVIRRALGVLAQMPDHIRISVNFSPLQLRSPTLVQFTLDRLAEKQISPRRFEVEVTETISIEGDRQAQQTLETLREHGVSIALDDFGTGYSSLTYICSLPITRVKIDRSFVASLGRNPQSMAVIQAILGLAHNLGLKVVAEGVETRLQYDVIAGHGCEEFQGYLLSRPLSAEAAVVCATSNNAVLQLVA